MENKYSTRIVMNYAVKVEGDDYKDIKRKSETHTTHHTKVYDEALEKLQELSKAERAVFFYLARTMNSLGLIYSNADTRAKFVREMTSKGEKEIYTDGTVKLAFMELKRKGFLIEKTRGVQWVNPLYVWRGREEDRVDVIKEAFEKTHFNLRVTIEQ